MPETSDKPPQGPAGSNASLPRSKHPTLPELSDLEAEVVGRAEADSFDALFALRGEAAAELVGDLPGFGTLPEIPEAAPDTNTPDAQVSQAEPDREVEEPDADQWDLSAIGGATPQNEESHVIGGRYRMLEGLAMGGLGAVFKVSHLQLEKVFALKLLQAGAADDRGAQRLFFREVQVLSQLDHPNIVNVSDFGSDDVHGAYLVMEYLKGETLYARLKRDRFLPVAQGLTIALQVADALRYMHQRSLVHCDLKPENLFLCRQRRDGRQKTLAKLIDFGLARRQTQAAKLTAKAVQGTPLYAAPEQLAGEAPNPSMDIYGVGVLLYAMLTGTVPFVGGLIEVLDQKIAGPPEPPSAATSNPLNKRIDELVLRAMSIRASDRHRSMSQLIYELRTLMDMMGIPHPGQRRKRTTGSLRPNRTTGSVDVPARLCQSVTLPLFLLHRDGRIRNASRSFGVLLDESVSALQGRTLGQTRLRGIYPEVDSHLEASIKERSPLKRYVSYQSPDGTFSMLLWIIPELGPSGEVDQLWGTLIPL